MHPCRHPKIQPTPWILSLVLCLVMPLSFATPTAEEILETYVEATGGREVHAGVNTFMRTGSLVVQEMGIHAETLAFGTKHDYIQTITVPGMGVVRQGIDEGRVWQQHFLEGNSILKGKKALSVKRQAVLNPWLDWKQYYASATFKDIVDGEYRVAFASKIPGDPESIAYFDTESGLLNRLETLDEKKLPTVYTYDDYREVNGIRIAHRVVIKNSMTVVMTTESIEINVELPENIFGVPEVIAALLKEANIPRKVITAAMVMEGMDKNGDGKIDMQEAPPALQGSFEIIDANHDGGIDLEEADIIAQYINQQRNP